MLKRGAIWALAFGALFGCASLTVTDTVPLRPQQLQPIGSQQISSDGYRLLALPVHGDAPIGDGEIAARGEAAGLG